MKVADEIWSRNRLISLWRGYKSGYILQDRRAATDFIRLIIEIVGSPLSSVEDCIIIEDVPFI